MGNIFDLLKSERSSNRKVLQSANKLNSLDLTTAIILQACKMPSCDDLVLYTAIILICNRNRTVAFAIFAVKWIWVEIININS